MEAPFDIAADLDTPVSAYMKLAAFGPRFLLESVEGGERLGRYSFLGFGAGLELVVGTDAVTLAGQRLPAPGRGEGWVELMRRALAGSPELAPAIEHLPFTGGLVGAT